MGTWPLAPAGPCPEELGVGRDYLGPNTSLASDGHFWANQASKDPTTATSPVPFIPLDHGFQDSVSRWPRGRTGIPLVPTSGHGPCCSCPSQGQHPARLEKGWCATADDTRPAKDGGRDLDPTVPFFPSAAFLGDGGLLCFDTPGTMNVGGRGSRGEGAHVSGL